MSKYYNANKTKNLYDPKGKEPFTLSRSKIDLFMQCPRCFYLDARLGTGRPPGFPLTLNVAVDHLLKKEFDIHRAKKTAHPMMQTYGIDAVPFEHTELGKWREPDFGRGGVRYLHKPTNFLVYGAVDDIWVNPQGELIVVDYKATAKATTPNLDGDLGAQYIRQMEVYQWLLKNNDFKVSKTGYFVYVNGRKDVEAFDGKLEFDVIVLPAEGETAWIESVLEKIKATLEGGKLPQSGDDCDYCDYKNAAFKKENEAAKEKEGGTLF
ncbi:MAG: PD-(D/E)XK nuclease family protein [bacterium]|nr:PD-(D/E)XK nuclease family protein [bacterium]